MSNREEVAKNACTQAVILTKKRGFFLTFYTLMSWRGKQDNFSTPHLYTSKSSPAPVPSGGTFSSPPHKQDFFFFFFSIGGTSQSCGAAVRTGTTTMVVARHATHIHTTITTSSTLFFCPAGQRCQVALFNEPFPAPERQFWDRVENAVWHLNFEELRDICLTLKLR